MNKTEVLCFRDEFQPLTFQGLPPPPPLSLLLLSPSLLLPPPPAFFFQAGSLTGLKLIKLGSQTGDPQDPPISASPAGALQALTGHLFIAESAFPGEATSPCLTFVSCFLALPCASLLLPVCVVQ